MKTLAAAYEAKITGWHKLEKTVSERRGRRRENVNFTPAFTRSALAWVLNNPDVSCLVKRISNLEDLKNILSASGEKYGIMHRRFLESYGKLIEGNYCRIGCSDCLASCPHNVAINDIMRYKMYFENYRSEKEGILCYKELPDEKKADTCRDCDAPCSGACGIGVNIRNEMIRAHDLLTV